MRDGVGMVEGGRDETGSGAWFYYGSGYGGWAMQADVKLGARRWTAPLMFDEESNLLG